MEEKEEVEEGVYSLREVVSGLGVEVLEGVAKE